MKTKKLKRLSLINLIAGYLMIMLFTLLIISNRSTELTAAEQAFVEAAVITEDELEDDELFDGRHDVEKEMIKFIKALVQIKSLGKYIKRLIIQKSL